MCVCKFVFSPHLILVCPSSETRLGQLEERRSGINLFMFRLVIVVSLKLRLRLRLNIRQLLLLSLVMNFAKRNHQTKPLFWPRLAIMTTGDQQNTITRGRELVLCASCFVLVLVCRSHPLWRGLTTPTSHPADQLIWGLPKGGGWAGSILLAGPRDH